MIVFSVLKILPDELAPIDKCAQKYEKKLMLHGEWWGYILYLQALKKCVGCVVVTALIPLPRSTDSEFH